MIRDYPGSVTVRIASIAASAASVVAMAGNLVQMSPTALLMIHDPSTIAMGNAKDMEKAISTLNEVKESIVNAYAFKTGLSRNRISKLMSDETWLNAKKAVELGFADEILFENKPKEPEEEEPDEKPEEPEKEEEGGDEGEEEEKLAGSDAGEETALDIEVMRESSLSSSLIVSNTLDVLCLMTLTNFGGATSVMNLAMRALAMTPNSEF